MPARWIVAVANNQRSPWGYKCTNKTCPFDDHLIPNGHTFIQSEDYSQSLGHMIINKWHLYCVGLASERFRTNVIPIHVSDYEGYHQLSAYRQKELKEWIDQWKKLPNSATFKHRASEEKKLVSVTFTYSTPLSNRKRSSLLKRSQKSQHQSSVKQKTRPSRLAKRRLTHTQQHTNNKRSNKSIQTNKTHVSSASRTRGGSRGSSSTQQRITNRASS